MLVPCMVDLICGRYDKTREPSQPGRAVARSENPGGHVILGGDNVPPLVEIGLTDLPKSGGARAPPAPPLATGL